uniref:Uncharacterized protein n=1 Tax=viral metagenome TaxID=1070528 RepID=A0A6M3JXH8_9ZZZZ
MDYRKWIFFRVLHIARVTKGLSVPKKERRSKLFWYRSGLFDGIIMYERR